MKVALIGNGAIAKCLTVYCGKRPDDVQIVGALSLHAEKDSAGDHPLVRNLGELLELRPELIVECAGHSAVARYAVEILDAGIDLMIASTGSLAAPEVWDAVSEAALRSRAQLRLPAGALPGIDALAAAKLGGLTRVKLRSAKPPRSWSGAARERGASLADITAPTVIFTGNAREAALAFPKNANVAATAALAGIGFERTEVELVADPSLSKNRHALEAEGGFGELRVEIVATPSPDNAKTSQIAALSLVRAIYNTASRIVV